MVTRPHSTVCNVSGNKCMADCRSSGGQFNPGPVHTFVEIDHEIISTVILLPSADSFKKGCCQLQAKVCVHRTSLPVVQACPGKSVVRHDNSCLLGCKATAKPKSAMVMSGWSVHLTTHFSWTSLAKRLTSTLCTYFRL